MRNSRRRRLRDILFHHRRGGSDVGKKKWWYAFPVLNVNTANIHRCKSRCAILDCVASAVSGVVDIVKDAEKVRKRE
jgi:hypothetical protein